MSVITRLKSAWNVFASADSQFNRAPEGPSYGFRPDRFYPSRTSTKSYVLPIYNRLAVDAASVTFAHAKVDDEKRFLEEKPTRLNDALTTSANIDQGPQAFRIDAYMTLFEEGSIAIVAVDAEDDPSGGLIDVITIRVGKVVDWSNLQVKVRLFNELKQDYEEVWVDKDVTPVVENPFYSIMNEPNSTMRRLVRKLDLLDRYDEKVSSSRLDIIIQLPYTIRGKTRQAMAENRLKSIEDQMTNSKFGIAYSDGQEKIVQLNRPAENTLIKEADDLYVQLLSQLGLTADILSGVADEKAMLNYFNRTIGPVVEAVREELYRKFLTKTARTQGQTIHKFRDPFALVPIEQIAEIADKFTRNEILTSNEMRQIVGRKPSDDPAANELRNSNMPAQDDSGLEAPAGEGGEISQDAFGEIEAAIEDAFAGLGLDDDDDA